MAKPSNTWGDRATIVRKRYGSPEELAALVPIEAPRMTEILAGAEPTFAELVLIVERTDLDGTWLLTGEGHYLKGTAVAKKVMSVVRELKDFFEKHNLPVDPQRITDVAQNLIGREEAMTLGIDD